MTITVAQFRANFPEFADISVYPDASVQFWLNYAYLRLNAIRWADSLDYGAQLFVAHYLTVARRNTLSAASGSGSSGGGVTGLLTQKKVDKVDLTFDVKSVINDGAGQYNATSYGVQYWDLMQMAGMGVVQLPAGCSNGGFGLGYGNW